MVGRVGLLRFGSPRPPICNGFPQAARGQQHMYQSPRTRRLRNDLLALQHLREESSVFRFSAKGDPPNHYVISLKGKGLWRDRGKIKTHEVHRVEIKLGASYPRTIPELRWMTPIYHPNISEIGMVCLGGYGTHWVPSVQLDELCAMLWDMARYQNYDIRSPYNREAALWVASQTAYLFPTDDRPLRDLRAAQGRISAPDEPANGESWTSVDSPRAARSGGGRPTDEQSAAHGAVARVRQFVDRYGRIFNGDRAPERTAHAADTYALATPQPAPTATPPRATATADPVPPAESIQSADGMLILEAEPTRAAQPSSRCGDEIVFIE
jgi:ubiquitin-protein ligase